MGIEIKRAYEEPGRDDGHRILVDRLWPRGLARQQAKIDEWLKDVAPSSELRRWFAHDPRKWTEFERRYFDELHEKDELVEHIVEETARQGKVTLLYGAKDTEHNNAAALRDYIGSTRQKRRTR